MRKVTASAERLFSVYARLGDAAIDPSIWPEILNEISMAVGSAGAGLLQSDVRTSDIPRSMGADEVISNYFKHGWHLHDVRAQRGVPLLLRGEKVVVDQDIVTPEEMKRLGFYTESLAPFGFQWFAAIGFWSGSALWGLSIQRTTREGPLRRGRQAHSRSALAAIDRNCDPLKSGRANGAVRRNECPSSR